jgi:hypothetical protein
MTKLNTAQWEALTTEQLTDYISFLAEELNKGLTVADTTNTGLTVTLCDKYQPSQVQHQLGQMAQSQLGQSVLGQYQPTGKPIKQISMTLTRKLV